MQEKYLFYRSGLTVSVKNSSNITIDELKIKLYLDGKEKLALTEFKKISPNESNSILYKGNIGTESQLILEYKDKFDKVKIEDAAYLTGSSKLVVEIEVKSIDKEGNLITIVKGLDGFQAFGN
ncbi:hypothetical protein NYR90_08910 [Clostridioides difficile]|nr:hypothetical protein NYR90_08910 [Clostridioides difficile]